MKRLALLAIILSAAPAGAQDSSSPKCALGTGVTEAQIRTGLCNFDRASRRFAGSPRDQARCLLQEVRRGREIGAANAPERLIGRAGAAVPFTQERLVAYSRARGVALAEVGLDSTRPLTAEYFVIHDTSSPNCSDREALGRSCPTLGVLPPLRDDARWPTNVSFGGHKPVGARAAVAHAWTNRVGESIVETPFDRHISHLKFDYCHDANSKRGLFLGVENIQPRVGDPPIRPPGRRVNDLVAPVPGFAASQYRRLALLYAAASAKRGHWLIPAYHAVIDRRYKGGHDDPQNFDISEFDEALTSLVDELSRP